MMNMAKNNQKKTPGKKAEDMVIYKACIDLAIFIVGFLLLRWASADYGVPDTFDAWRCGLQWTAIACIPLTIAGIVLSVLKKQARKAWIAATIGVAIFGLVCLALYIFAYEPLPYLYFLLIAGCALYLVKLLYPMDFFIIATVTTLSGTAFYLHGHWGYASNFVLALYILNIVVMAVVIFLCKNASANDGRVICKKCGKSKVLYAGKAGATPMYATCAILLACTIAALIIGSVFAYYCVYAAAAYLFIAACYYTIRLN